MPQRTVKRKVKASTSRHRAVVRIKRAYAPASREDGTRVLIDRLWPRGVTKERLALDLWLKEAAPSDSLRRWFGHKPERWESFATRYRAELAQHPDVLEVLEDLCRRGPVTLVYGARDEQRNDAVVLRELLEARTGR